MGWLPDIINDHLSDSQAPTISSQVYKVNSSGMPTYFAEDVDILPADIKFLFFYFVISKTKHAPIPEH
jgi:hypothetical protein